MKRGHRFAILSKGKTGQRGKMNKTEARYYETLFADPAVVKVMFEPFTLRLSHPPVGQPATYTPDFLVLLSDGTTYIDEVKGTGVNDAASIVRLKCAAEQFSLWTFRLCQEQRGGGFVREEV